MTDSPGLFEVVRNKIRVKHYSIRTEKTYIYWIKSYLQFYSLQHPRELGASQIEAFLTHLAVDRKVSASTQNQALSALLFLYKVVLEIELPYLDDVTRAKKKVACASRIHARRSFNRDSESPATLFVDDKVVIWFRPALDGMCSPAHQGYRFSL